MLYEKGGTMKEIKKIAVIFLLLMILLLHNPISEANYYDAITVQPIGQGDTANKYLRSFIVPAVSYSSGATRKYAIRLLSGNNSAANDKRQIRIFIDSNSRSVYTFGALYGGHSITGTGILGKDGTSLLAISGYDTNIKTYSGHLFTTRTRSRKRMGK